MSIRRRIGNRLRRWADRIDVEGAPRYMSPYSFTIEAGEGIRFREDQRGCPLAYLSPEDHDRRYTEADNPGPWVDWATMTLRKVPHP